MELKGFDPQKFYNEVKEIYLSQDDPDVLIRPEDVNVDYYDSGQLVLTCSEGYSPAWTLIAAQVLNGLDPQVKADPSLRWCFANAKVLMRSDCNSWNDGDSDNDDPHDELPFPHAIRRIDEWLSVACAVYAEVCALALNDGYHLYPQTWFYESFKEDRASYIKSHCSRALEGVHGELVKAAHERLMQLL